MIFSTNITQQLHISLNRTAQIYLEKLELHFCVELHTKLLQNGKILTGTPFRAVPVRIHHCV